MTAITRVFQAGLIVSGVLAVVAAAAFLATANMNVDGFGPGCAAFFSC